MSTWQPREINLVTLRKYPPFTARLKVYWQSFGLLVAADAAAKASATVAARSAMVYSTADAALLSHGVFLCGPQRRAVYARESVTRLSGALECREAQRLCLALVAEGLDARREGGFLLAGYTLWAASG